MNKTLDEQIADALAQSQRSGELQSAASWGKPLELEDAYARTPEELRMGFKILKNAGIVPPEVEMLREIAEMKQQLAACEDEAQRTALNKRIADAQQAVALRLEKLAATRSV